jgi:DNA damage-binding protein 1
VSVIDLIESEGGEMRLEAIAKDYRSLWPVSIESLDYDTIIGANVSLPSHKLPKFIDHGLQSDCNLFTYTVQRVENQTTLERDGYYHLGDVVNKFIPGNPTIQPTDPTFIPLKTFSSR